MQIYQLQGEIHSTGSWRREKTGRHSETNVYNCKIKFRNSFCIILFKYVLLQMYPSVELVMNHLGPLEFETSNFAFSKYYYMYANQVDVLVL